MVYACVTFMLKNFSLRPVCFEGEVFVTFKTEWQYMISVVGPLKVLGSVAPTGFKSCEDWS